MVDAEDITLKIKTQELSLEFNTLSDTFQQNTSNQETPPEPPHVQAVDPKNESKPQFKKYCSFCYKKIILFLHVIVDSICLMNVKPNPNHPLRLSINN